MNQQERQQAAADFDGRLRRGDGLRLVNSLADGLNVLSNSFYIRIHSDVESVLGTDSMMLPVRFEQVEVITKAELEIYQIVESAVHVLENCYISAADEWYLWWLARLRLGDRVALPLVANRIEDYMAKSSDDRRRSFSRILERTLPEARKAHLIVYRLFPWAVKIATAVAFADAARAQEARKQQAILLPHLCDCHDCHGALLDNGERCPQCGNPFWNFDWLTAD
jgi:hypothetical protein